VSCESQGVKESGQASHQTVPVQVQGQQYRIRTEADPDTVKRAATLLDETMGRVRSRAGTVDSRDIAVLAGLNIANSLVSLREQSGAGSLRAVRGRVEALVSLVEGVVGEPPASIS